MNTVTSWILTPVITLVVGAFAKYGVDLLKGFITAFDQSPAWLKQGAAIAVALVLTVAAHYGQQALFPATCTATGTDVDACLNGLTNTDAMKALLGGLVAIALKHGQQNTAAS